MTRVLPLVAVLALLAGGPLVGPVAASHEIVVGLQCDRTGATQTVGVFLCPGAHDYVKVVNWKGGVAGHKIRLVEIDHQYQVPLGVEAYERFKKEGAVSIMLYGTPHTYALTPKLTEDRIPGTSPGFGRADATDGLRFPYIFPIAASYWSQAGASVKFVKDQLGGLKGKKIAYLFYDNPAGREPIPIFEALAEREGFQLRTFAAPPPGLEMGAQVLDIAQRYRADFVITHLFGRSPSVSIKELKRVGYRMNRVLSFVWGAAEADVEAAGWPTSEGYYALEITGVGSGYPIHKEIIEAYKAEGKEPSKEMASTVYYNRGIQWAAMHVEAIRNAVKKFGSNVRGEQVKQGFEMVKGVTLGGLLPPLDITPTDHEGGGWVQVWQVKRGKWEKVIDWFRAYRELILDKVAEAGKKAG